MKGFIEVYDKVNDCLSLVNVNYIEEVRWSVIYLAFNPPEAAEQDFIVCAEDYETIKKMIAEGGKE